MNGNRETLTPWECIVEGVIDEHVQQEAAILMRHSSALPPSRLQRNILTQGSIVPLARRDRSRFQICLLASLSSRFVSAIEDVSSAMRRVSFCLKVLRDNFCAQGMKRSVGNVKFTSGIMPFWGYVREILKPQRLVLGERSMVCLSAINESAYCSIK